MLSWAELNTHKQLSESQKNVLKNNLWKNSYFIKNPDADLNKDGILSWPELKAHKKK